MKTHIFLLVSIVLAGLAFVKADKKFTIESMSTDPKSQVKSIDTSFGGSFFSGRMEIDNDWKNAVTAYLKVFMDDNLFTEQTFDIQNPMVEIERKNMCQDINPPAEESDDWSLPSGKHAIEECDLTKLTSGLPDGNARIEMEVKMDEAVLFTLLLLGKVESS